MPQFKCHLVNRANQTVYVDSVEAENEVGAMRAAANLIRTRHSTFHAIEVWHKDSFVARLENKNSSQAGRASRLDGIQASQPSPSERP
jgi:hypothetical protein